MKTILISGASGFVGRYLSRRLMDMGHTIIGLGTSARSPFEGESHGFSWVSADTTVPGAWQDQVGAADVIINLTGRSIFKPWTEAYKKAIYDSRILTTQNIVRALPEVWEGHLLNTSAIGYYGDRGDTSLSEDAAPGDDFLAGVCRDWEAEAGKAAEKGASVSLMRFGVVLGQGGALTVMEKAFKLFAGGPLGNGQHWFPWIHIEDLARAVCFLMERQESGAFNFTGPETVRQKEFARALGHALGRPAFIRAPAFMIRILMGELGASLLQSQRAAPTALVSAGFEFRYKALEKALSQIYSHAVNPD